MRIIADAMQIDPRFVAPVIGGAHFAGGPSGDDSAAAPAEKRKG